MLKTLKFSGEESNFFFISDLHQGHNREFLWGKRGFKNLEEHDLANIHNWNSVCSHVSTVFHLGDLIFNDGTGEKFWKLLDRLNFKVLYLLLGNHVSGQRQAYLKVLKEQFPNAIDEINNNLKYEVYPLEYNINQIKKIVFLPQYAEISINSTMLTICHYPIISHNKQNHHSIMLTGHSHSNCPITNKNTGQGMRLDVGVESVERPTSLKEIKFYLKDRSLDSVDHHASDESSA